MAYEPSIPSYIMGSMWRCTEELTVKSFVIPANSPFKVMNSCGSPRELKVQHQREDGTWTNTETIPYHFNVSFRDYHLVEQSKRTFYTVRHKETGRLLKDTSVQERRFDWGYVKMYLTLNGAIDRLAASCRFDTEEVVAFTASDERNKVATITPWEAPEGWTDRVSKLHPYCVKLGAAVLEDTWETAIIISGRNQKASYHKCGNLIAVDGKHVRSPKNLAGGWSSPWVFLFDSRTRAVKSRLAISDCEMVQLR